MSEFSGGKGALSIGGLAAILTRATADAATRRHPCADGPAGRPGRQHRHAALLLMVVVSIRGRISPAVRVRAARGLNPY